MHPLIITALYPPAVGGAASHFGQIAPELARRDEIERVTVLTEVMPEQPGELCQGKLRVLRRLPTRISLPQRPWLWHALTYVLTQCWFAAHLPGLARRLGVDVIHFHTRYGGRLFYSSLRRCGVPVIADLHDKMTDPLELVGLADELLCCGEGVRRFALQARFPAERIVLIPIPFERPEIPLPGQVATARRRYGLGGARYVLFVGDVTRNKGVYELLEAHRRWRSDHPGVLLVLAGTNREGDRFLAEIEAEGDVVYLGHVPHVDALTLIRGAEMLVLPSRSEGLPRVMLEALALGTKVICPPNIPEFERHLPTSVLGRVQVDAIGEMLDRVWEDTQVPAYPFDEHSLSRVVERVSDVYARAVGRKRE